MSARPGASPPRSTTASDGVRLRFTLHPGGRAAPVLLAAGTGYGGATWPQEVIEALRVDRPVVTYDHRGTGGSGSSEGPYSTRLFAADAAAIIEAVDLGPVHLLGHSMGGRLAQWVALDRPDLVASLILAASGSGRASSGTAGTRGVPYHTALGLARDGYRAYIRAQIASTFFTPDYGAEHPDRLGWLLDAFWRSRPDLADYLKHVVARQAHDTGDSIGLIGVPTLVVVGDRDTHRGGTGNHWDQSRSLAEEIPDAEFRPVEGVAHGLFWQWPERTLKVVREWLPGR
ncbi:MAG: alpha/beta fold hydrolase [Candidatus Limnocylindrales bacterium]